MSAPFLLRNLPKSQRENVKNELRMKELEEELKFYKSIFKTRRNSAVFNLRIKTINGEKIWIDKIKISTEYSLLNSLDEDDEVREWKTPSVVLDGMINGSFEDDVPKITFHKRV